MLYFFNSHFQFNMDFKVNSCNSLSTCSLKRLYYMQGRKKSSMPITLSLVLRIFVTSKSSLTDSVSSSFSADLLTSKTSMLSKRSWKKRRKISKLRIEKILEKTKKKSQSYVMRQIALKTVIRFKVPKFGLCK